MDSSKIINKGALIDSVFPGSIASEVGLEPGDLILKINNQELTDLIDFEFLWADEEVSLQIQKKSTGSNEIISIEKDYDEPLGVEFASAVFDKIKMCHNKCVFCFVDQMPPDMRATLYDKDDDYRLSFLQGNFITLTNISQKDKQRIIEQRLSPLYVSVQSADPENRVTLLKNPKAANIIRDLKELTEAGIDIHAQIVLCKGFNDGDIYTKSLETLYQLGEGIVSLGIVPVGVTKYRKDLCHFPSFTKEDAKCIIEAAEKLQSRSQKERGYRFVYLADEFYIKAEQNFPKAAEYDDFFQLENGIGLSRIFIDDFNTHKVCLLQHVNHSKKIFTVSGKSPALFLQKIISEINQMIKGLEIELVAIENNFFGNRVTVTGLLTGSDLIIGLQHIPEGSDVLIPSIMLKQGESLFLDNLTVKDIEEARKINISVFDNSFTDFLEKAGIQRG